MKDKKPKSRAAVALGRKRMAKLTPAQKAELGRKAAEARWKKEKEGNSGAEGEA